MLLHHTLVYPVFCVFSYDYLVDFMSESGTAMLSVCLA